MLGSQDILIVLFALAGGNLPDAGERPAVGVAAEVLPAALLGALVAVGGFGTGEALVVDARTAGLAAAALARAARGGLIGPALAAATVAALARVARVARVAA